MKNHRYQLSLPLLISAAVSAALPGMAYAQLEEVLVTAERREASVQDVPIAVSAYGEEMIERLQIDDTLDLINVVPNLFGGNNTGLGTANMYYLRAQGNDESISTFDPPVDGWVKCRNRFVVSLRTQVVHVGGSQACIVAAKQVGHHVDEIQRIVNLQPLYHFFAIGADGNWDILYGRLASLGGDKYFLELSIGHAR